MMKKYIYSIMIGAFGVLSLSGCNNDVVEPDEGQQVPIMFSANLPSVTVESQTRATTFSNEDKVAIVAANATAVSPIPTNWTSDNLYLNHETGTIGNATWEHGYAEYPITLSSLKYWYFEPNKYLSFVAYSPIPSVDIRVTRPNSDMKLTVNGAAPGFFPDLLYTGTIGNYNKTRVSVLFDFKHAMARLAVKVIVVDQDGNILPSNAHPVNQLKISLLVVNTKVTQGNFDLVSSQWTLANPGTSYQTAYTLATSSSMLPVPYDNTGSTPTSVCYLLPSTSAVNVVSSSSINFKVKDTNMGIEVGGDYPLDQFKQIDGSPLTLEMGKTTVLLIKLQYTAIPPVSPTIQLQGQLIEWDYKGTSTVVIE